MSLKSDLVGAVARREISAWYQPQVDIVSGRIVAAEALSRWLHPIRGLLQPAKFIPASEKSGLIHEIGAFMLDQACSCAADLALKGHPIEVAVNVSATQLATERFFEHVLELLRKLHLAEGALTVEVTETRAIVDRPAAARRLERLRDLGVDVSIDDFGSGNSSLFQMLALPTTELKLDKSLLHDRGNASTATIQKVIPLAHDRGIRVVAEGIETDDQLARARELGCDRAQGYFISEPVPQAELVAMLTGGS